jgi:hypothetical protein
MRVSKDPMAPLQCWKELLFGDRSVRSKKQARQSRERHLSAGVIPVAAHVGVVE